MLSMTFEIGFDFEFEEIVGAIWNVGMQLRWTRDDLNMMMKDKEKEPDK